MYICWYTRNYEIAAAILHLWLPVSTGSVANSTIETFDFENMEVAVGILFVASLEAEKSILHYITLNTI